MQIHTVGSGLSSGISRGHGVSLVPSVKYPFGRTIMTQVIEGNYTDVSGLRGLINGAAVLDTSSAYLDLREPKPLHLLSRFPVGANVRTWLPGK